MKNVPSRSLGPRGVVATLGPLQILAWGSTFYLLAILGRPIAADTGIVAGLSVALLAAGLVAPVVSAARLPPRVGAPYWQ